MYLKRQSEVDGSWPSLSLKWPDAPTALAAAKVVAWVAANSVAHMVHHRSVNLRGSPALMEQEW
jgi:hypothetical protein